jgi:CheY-like chemotaxis protein/HPt (histidine-containing phosphotransfer) domain-containing protein
MSLSRSSGGMSQAALDALRHDLLNPLNVVAGATTGLLESELSEAQRAWVQMIQSATARLHDVIRGAERYDTGVLAEGRARLADLCSIAAARVGKPFDRQRLVEAIEAVAGHRHLRILLVDDSPDLALLVTTYLAPTGWTLDVVETGERAVVQATTAQYDVVLMDIDLPGLDGATAAHAIRAADLARGVSPTPIIAMTAFDPGQSSAPTPADGRTAVEGARAPTAMPHVVTIDDPEIAPLVPEFLELRRADVRAFRDALAAGAYAAIQSTAHKMKGTGRGYGFDTISRLGGALEVAAHEQDVDTMRQLIDELDDYLSHVSVVPAPNLT